MDEWLSSVTDINIQTRLFYKSTTTSKNWNNPNVHCKI